MKALLLVIFGVTLGCASADQWQPSYCSQEFNLVAKDLAIELEVGELVPSQGSLIGTTIRNNGAQKIEICLDTDVSLLLERREGSSEFLGLLLYGITTHVRCARELLLKPGEGLNSTHLLQVGAWAVPGPASLRAQATVSRSPNCEALPGGVSATLRGRSAVLVSSPLQSDRQTR